MSGKGPDRNQWLRVKQLVADAATRSPAERLQFLADLGPEDAAVRGEVESLLAAHDRAGDFFDRPTPAVSALSDAGVSLPRESAHFSAGHPLGSYEILAAIGAGGMGEVYRARDTKLGRDVAVKLLPETFTHDPERLARFRREAQILAALNHPHIGAIYSLEEDHETMFLVLELVDGDSIDKQIARAPFSEDASLTIAVQITGALQAAHEKGIVHRDLKPANIALTGDGQAKVLDFGLATSRGAPVREVALAQTATLTQTDPGVILGTAAYMSPEQARGQSVDTRTDIWAFGCVLYEMVAGRPAFRRGTRSETVAAILEREPEWQALPPATSPGVRRLLQRCLEKDPERRPSDMREIRVELEATQEARRTAAGRSRRIAAAVMLLVFAAGIGLWIWNRNAKVRWARETALPEAMRLADHEAFPAAFSLAEQAALALPANDPALTDLWPRISTSSSFVTVPPGADISMKEYGADDATWRLLGRSPLENLRLPMGVFEWKVEKAGYEPMRIASPNPGVLLRNLPAYASLTLELQPAGSVPAGMVSVPGGDYPVRLTGFSPRGLVGVNPFFIDRYEVSNRAFKEFIDRGGYENATYWTDPDVADGHTPIPGAVKHQFHDMTGKPAPAGWELANFPRGQDDYPVTGVSWYEALAFCRSNGKTLPTVFHWSRAAMSPGEHLAPLLPANIPRSNFDAKGPVRVGSLAGIGPYGTFDMGGNVREWAWNKAGGNRWILGGSWEQPIHMYTVSNNAPPIDRSPTNGFRCAMYGDPHVPEQLTSPVELRVVDYRTAPAVSDEVFRLFKQRFSYDRTPLNARVEATDQSHPDWNTEKVTFDAGYNGERVIVYLTLPKHGTTPYQVVLAFPGLGPFQNRGGIVPYDTNDFIVKSGRAVVQPVFKGSYERWDGLMGLVGQEYQRTFRERVVQWYQDLGRTLDYLSTRPEFDSAHVAFTGLSFGASIPLPLLAVEPRVKTAVLMSAGFSELRLPPEADPINYVSRITIPLVMICGRYDYVLPLETAQRPLFERFGTRPADKRHAILEAGHTPLPRSDLVRETLEWLDRYLGPVSETAR
jgi:eukaryotic-like serine/threonine-protein kinase